MGLPIKDGTGTGNLAEVTATNKLSTQTVILDGAAGTLKATVNAASRLTTNTQIQDGGGSTDLANVTTQKRLEVDGLSLSLFELAGIERGDTYVVTTLLLTVTAAEGLMLYVQNSHATEKMPLHRLTASWDGGSTNFNRPCFLRIEHSTAAPSANNTVGAIRACNISGAAGTAVVNYWDEVAAGMTAAAGTTWRRDIIGQGVSVIDLRGYSLDVGDTIGIFADGGEIGELALTLEVIQGDFAGLSVNPL